MTAFGFGRWPAMASRPGDPASEEQLAQLRRAFERLGAPRRDWGRLVDVVVAACGIPEGPPRRTRRALSMAIAFWTSPGPHQARARDAAGEEEAAA